MPRYALLWPACALAMVMFAGCDAGPQNAQAAPAQPLDDPYAPSAGRSRTPSAPRTAGAGTPANAPVEAALARVESKLDETLKLLYDIAVVNDRRFTALEARLQAQTALLAPAGGAAVAPTTPEPPAPEAVKPAARPAPEWTPAEKKWVEKYTARFEGTTPTATAEPQYELIGAKLPVTRYLSLTGGAFDLNDYVKQKQRVVLVILRGFSGSICLYCSSQTLALSRAEEEFKKRNAQVVLVYPGEAETVPMFLDAVNKLDPKTDVPFPIGMDVDLSAVHQFRIRGELAKPASIVVDETGIVRYAYVGANATDRPTVKELLDALDKLKK